MAESQIPGWLRAIFLFVALQALELVVVFFRPDMVSLLVPWPATPLNARFIAALYTSLGLGVLVCTWAHHFREVRLVLLGIGIATGALLVLTLPQLGELNPFPLWWMVFYIIDPILVAVSFWRLGWGDTAPAQPNPLKPLWLVQAVLWGVSGLVLLVWPAASTQVWPWALTVPLAQLYSIFFLTLAMCAGLAAVEPRWDGGRVIAAILMILAVLVLAVSIFHFERFKPGLPTLVWFIFFGAEAVIFGGLLLGRQFGGSTKGAAV